MKLSIIILAAGQGTRMKSQTPKVLHQLGGKALLEHVVATVEALKPQNIEVVYGFQGEQLKKAGAKLPVHWVHQAQQLGTAHAVLQALPYCSDDNQLLILYADVPLISENTLRKLLALTQNTVGLITAEFSDPTGLGRIIRNPAGEVRAIVEQKDASLEQLKITEINTGILSGPVALFKELCPQIGNKNKQQEFYLTDLMGLLVKAGKPIVTLGVENMAEVKGVNDRWQLAELERHHQREKARELCLQGVTIVDPNRFDLRGELETHEDVSIDVNVIIEGKVKLGARTKIGPNVVLKNVNIGEDAMILANSIIENATIGNHSVIGPFARIRPGTQLADHVRIGNFVEVKNSEIGAHTKASHLSYIGDATIGSNVNIGAGTITCNFDGVNKHRTIIQDDVFVGSNSSLVAPVTLEESSTIGAGSVITQTAPAKQLTLARNLQTSISNWQRPKLKEEK
ncbi:MAG TPA: bifunctional UDP-N-acetylglucosamine diphosphorylase/glucosamine-1-phosphate N-acetyltransferase GlmU [Coxiellaceae bacterium]|nr:bifunctional UDP-N-acetylglucosamine diphosphorylase/glucosamine-1-phosphate N-acetyltransferase GlmU [Coxiellaceae bacterium]